MPDPVSGEWERFLSNLELKYPVESKLAFEIIAKMDRIWEDVRPHDALTDKLMAASRTEGKIEASMLFHVMIIALIKHFMEIDSLK